MAGALVLTLPINLRAIGAPRVLPDYLLFVAVAGGAFTLLSTRFSGRWLVVALAMLTAWWVAQAPPARPEFWRAGLGVTIYALFLVRRPLPGVLAASLTGIAALWLAGAAPVWWLAASIPAGICLALSGTTVSAAPAGAFLAAPAGAFLSACLALACFASGRIMTGRLGPVEAAALATVAAPTIWPLVRSPIARRLTGQRPSKRDARVAVRRRRS